ncbi:helix-turn-helix transcriptional regulator [Aeromonas veronii]|jgi:predicted DNA-binding transcriptional regulator AlpA|uniref:helix-turn-helix transcriptional regulator n=1 Tax=Aeromonas veronii TaxID=654 RepID=UPI00111BCE07|nr:hypothetical protein [Aeromonas veronii]TNI15491.1 hypothetical protein CF106_00305 [Aeromonas veronii]
MAYKRKTEEVLIGSNGLPVGLVGIPELAKFFGVHGVTIHRWVADGRLPKPFRDLSKRQVWQWQDIHSLIEQLKSQAAPV